MNRRDVDILASTLWGEARGEPQEGKVAVANVVLNRHKKPGWWSRQKGDGVPDDTIAAVCLDPYQFSCWNKKDPNYPKIQKLKPEDAEECWVIAGLAVAGFLRDNTSGATHYKTERARPKWARGKKPVVVIGNHQFYNNIK